MSGNDESPPVTLISSPDRGDDGGSDGRLGTAGVVSLVVVALVALILVGTERGSRPAAPATPSASDAAVDQREVGPARLGEGPVLDEPVGLAIAIGGGEREIHLIDLDTGDVSSLGRPGTPRLVDDGRLLVQDDRDRWEVIDLGTGRTDTIVPEGDAPRYGAVVAAEAEGVWFRRGAGLDGRVWSRVAPETGEVLQEVTVPAGARVVSDVNGVPLAGPEVVGSEAGAIYTLAADGGYRRRLDGHLIAFDEQLLLVAACGRFACQNQWIDRRSLDVVDIPAPEPRLLGGYIRGDTTLVAETPGPSNAIVKVFDLTTGRAIATGSPSGLARTWVSPSGRFIAVPGFNALLIIDTRRGRTATIDRLILDQDTQLAWGRT